MTDETTALRDIASAISQLRGHEDFWKTSPGQIIIWLLGILTGILTGVLLEWLKRQSNRAYVRHSLVMLLGDEILFRWDECIGADIRDELAGTSSPIKDEPAQLARVREFGESVINVDDLPIFHRCCDKSVEVDVFSNPRVLSEVIYVDVLFHDLVDGHSLIVRELEHFDRATPEQRAAAVRSLSEAWEAFRDAFERIEQQIATVWVLIAKDYDALVGKSDGGGRSERDGKVIASMSASKKLRRDALAAGKPALSTQDKEKAA